jgi:hypothetical protein
LEVNVQRDKLGKAIAKPMLSWRTSFMIAAINCDQMCETCLKFFQASFKTFESPFKKKWLGANLSLLTSASKRRAASRSRRPSLRVAVPAMRVVAHARWIGIRSV